MSKAFVFDQMLKQGVANGSFRINPGSSEAGGGSQGDVPAVVAPLFSQDLEDFLEVVIPRLDEGLRGMRTALGDAFTLAGLTTRSSIGSLHSRDNILEVVSSVFASMFPRTGCGRLPIIGGAGLVLSTEAAQRRRRRRQ